MTRQPAIATGLAVLLAGGLAMAGCTPLTPQRRESAPDRAALSSGVKPRVVVLSEAHRALAARVAGESAEVVLLSTESPREPQRPPSRQVILAMQNADRILVNGRGQEAWLEKVSLPEGTVVELADGLDRLASATGGIAHRHGPTGVAHSHGQATLPWLDLQAAALETEAVREALITLVPDQAAAFRRRTAALLEELGELDRAFMAATAALKGRTVLIVGDDLAAFSQRYRLAAIPLTERPEDEPKLFLQELDRRRGGSGTVLLLTSPPPGPLAGPLQNRGVIAVVLQTGMTQGAAGDYFAQLRSNLDTLGTGLNTSGIRQPG
jgi:zinc transport system substrate-binding protein